jgi:serine/threonine protein phosphatase PrpC
MLSNIEIFTYTRKGSLHSINEDNWCVYQDCREVFIALCDGVTTEPDGEIASSKAAALALGGYLTLDGADCGLSKVITHAQESFCCLGLKGCSTLTLADFKGNDLRYAGVSTERIFCIRGKSVVTVFDPQNGPPGQAIGIRTVVPAEGKFGLSDGDIYLFCTDGFRLNEQQIEFYLRNDIPFPALCRLLGEYSSEWHGTDDITVIAARVTIKNDVSKLIGEQAASLCVKLWYETPEYLIFGAVFVLLVGVIAIGKALF